MELKKIAVTNFKGVGRLEFEPKRINLVVGKNNSGKTSLLEGVYLLEDTAEKILEVGKGKYASNLINVSGDYAEIVGVSDKETHIKLKKPDPQLVGIELRAELIKNFKEIPKYPMGGTFKFNEEIKKEIENQLTTLIAEDLVKQLSNDSIGIIKEGIEKVVLSYRKQETRKKIFDLIDAIVKHLNKKFGIKINTEVVQFVLFRGFGSALRVRIGKKDDEILFIRELKIIDREEDTGEENARRIYEIDKIIKQHNLIKNLEKFDFDFLIFRHEDKPEPTTIPYAFMGDGFKAIIALLWHLLQSNIHNKIILLEEPETHMHPGYVQELVKFIIKFSKENNIQFFITTHSIDFIDSFFDEGLEEERKYLEEQFILLRMEKTKGHDTSQALMYNDAKRDKNELLTDLRGI